MSMLSSHRIAPSIVSGYGDHGLDQSGLNSPSHLMISDRTNISSDRSSMAIDRPGMLNDRMTFVNDRSSYGADRTSFVTDRSSFSSDRPSFLSDRPRITSDRPSVLNERKSSSIDRLSVPSERSMPNQRMNYPTDHASVLNERQNIPTDRCVIPNGRHNSPDDRHYIPESRPAVSADRVIERPSISFERTSNRPTIPIERSPDRSSERPNLPNERSVTPKDHGRQSKSPHNTNMIPDRTPIHPTSYSKTTIFRGEMFRGPNDSKLHPDSREYVNRFEGQRVTKSHPETSRDNADADTIQPRNISDSSYSTRHPYHVHPSTTQHSPKLSENHPHIYNNYSIVSANSVRPIMVPTTAYEKTEHRFKADVNSSLSPSHVGEHVENYDKARWKHYNFIDKSAEYLTNSCTQSTVITSETHEKHRYTLSHASVSPFPHTNVPDKLPSYNSISHDMVSKSPRHYPYLDANDNVIHCEKSNMPEKIVLSEKQSDRQYTSRSPSSGPEHHLDKPELLRKPFRPQECSSSNARTLLPVKRSYISRNSPESYDYSEHPAPIATILHSPKNPDKRLHLEESICQDQSIKPFVQTFPYNKSPIPERSPSLPCDNLSALHEGNSRSPDIHTMSTREQKNSPRQHSILRDRPRHLHSPVLVNGTPDPAKSRTMSEIQPLYGNTENGDRPCPLERSDMDHKQSEPTIKSPAVTPDCVGKENPLVSCDSVTLLNEKQLNNDTETEESRKSPLLLNGITASEKSTNGHSSPDEFVCNDSVHSDHSSENSPRSHVNNTSNFDVSDMDADGNGRMASPVPPVVILNPDDAPEDDAGMASFDETIDDENENDLDENMDEGNGDSPSRPLRDHPVLSSERPSMLSDSPSMVSAISVRPSMVNSDCNSEHSMTDPLTPSDKPNVVKRGKRKKYQKYTPADRIAIGKFCFEHGPAAARKAFQSRYPEMSESVTRGFRDKYKLMIGEYAVYMFEQKRRREMHARTESLPRGRPRKYKQIEADEKPSLPVTTTSAPVLPQVQTPVPTPLLEPPKPVNNEHDRQENGVIEESKVTLKKEYTREEKLLIGWFCAKHGGEVALNVFSEEHPDLTLDMVIIFHKMYIESEGQIKDNDKADVYVVETDNNTIQTPPSSNGLTSQSESDLHRVPSPNESSEIASRISEDRLSSERDLDAISKTDEVRLNNSECVSPVAPSSRPAVTIPVSPHTMTPIIHYPKISPDGALRTPQPLEPREYKQEFKIEHNGETLGYPYDRQLYMYDDPMANGSSSLPRTKRFKYQKYSPEDRYNIGKLCNDIGLGATVKVYREQFPRLNESVVRTFRNKYRELLQKGNGVPVTEAIQRKPSRRSITTVIESEVVSQLRQFKQSNIEINEKLVIAIAENIIATKDQKDIGPVKNTVTKEWASSLLWKHKLVERQVSNPNGVCCERCKTPLVCPKC